ncbi:thiamine phosphate synthase [Chryseobacterium indoltheticum]|uniref:thiamine phosphate synthase n=1 Tax=Chryseobacterium indoltheticum TaxID=254 RepID=UPI001911B718|nr:thiamine phosphate synthase [Chryseobacterium indoltheticum]QQQ28138.1 thiamine phosphate synthase [Chryseobacterium indoltheticum]
MILKPSFPYQLYLVISEEDCLGKDFLDVAEKSILGGVDIIQLREKNTSTEDFLRKALALKEITYKYNIPLIINDNFEVAEKIGSVGIHVGNNDKSPSSLRNELFFKDKIIGYSIEYLSQLENVNTELSDYLGISPIFSTDTKKDTVTEWGLEGLKKIRSLTEKPLVAIGNINSSNAASIIKAGADALAVVSAICSAQNPEKAAFEIKNKILK